MFSVELSSNVTDPADLAAHAERGPYTLEEVVELCKALEADATLRDEPGFIKGWVKADGSYRLQ